MARSLSPRRRQPVGEAKHWQEARVITMQLFKKRFIDSILVLQCWVFTAAHRLSLLVLRGAMLFKLIFNWRILLWNVVLLLFINMSQSWAYTHVPSTWTSCSTVHHDVLASDCAGCSRCRAQAQGTPVSSWRVGSVAVTHVLRFHVACGIPPARRWNPCPLHWQADSQALYPQEAPTIYFQSWAPSVPVMITYL